MGCKTTAIGKSVTIRFRTRASFQLYPKHDACCIGGGATALRAAPGAPGARRRRIGVRRPGLDRFFFGREGGLGSGV